MSHDWEQMASICPLAPGKRTNSHAIFFKLFYFIVYLVCTECLLWACRHSVHTLGADASFTLTLICVTLATLLPLIEVTSSFICRWAASRRLPNRFCTRVRVRVAPACVREQRRRTVWPANLSSSACLFSLSGLCLISEHSCEGKKSPVCAVCARICVPFFIFL